MPDPLLQRHPPEALPASLRSAWQRSMDLRGDAAFMEVFGSHPELFDWYARRFYGEVFDEGVVSRPFKELLRLRLSTQHGCRFCNQGNRADALAAGLSETHVDSIADEEAECWGPAELAILKLADRLSLNEPMGRLDEDLYAELSACFSDAQILELGLVGGVLTGMAKFLFAYDLVEKESDCPFHPDTHTETP